MRHISRNISITMICIILGVMLSWQYKSIDNNKKLETFQNKRLEDLKDELILEKKNNDNLRKRNDELTKQNMEYENARGNLDIYEKNLKQELEWARIVAGLTAVKGKGIIITLDNGEDKVVVDEEILALLNELKASDAQAISVNEERIVSTSEVRLAGKYIVINNRQMVAPFVIKAIAEPDKLENALRMIGGQIEKLQDWYGLKVSLEKKDNVIIPKVRDDGSVIKTELLTPVDK